MRYIVFDTGAVISLATNNLLWILKPLKKQFKGVFCIPKAVKAELIDKPLKSLKYKLEAMQVLSEIMRGDLKIVNKVSDNEVKEVLDLVNHIFRARGKHIEIAQTGEIAVIALSKALNAEALVIDERTTRVLIEDPKRLAKLLGKRLHTKVSIEQKKLAKFREYTKGLNVIRSAELGILAYEIGLFDKYNIPGFEKYIGGNPKKIVLEGLLWGLKLNGCAISKAEIDDFLKIEGFIPL